MKYQVIIIGGGPAGYTAAEATQKIPCSKGLSKQQSVISQRVCSFQNCFANCGYCCGFNRIIRFPPILFLYHTTGTVGFPDFRFCFSYSTPESLKKAEIHFSD